MKNTKGCISAIKIKKVKSTLKDFFFCFARLLKKPSNHFQMGFIKLAKIFHLFATKIILWIVNFQIGWFKKEMETGEKEAVRKTFNQL